MIQKAGKKLIILIVILNSYNFAMAQNIEGEIIAGLNASQIDGDQLAGFNKPGLYFGGAAGIPLKEGFEAQFRILFSQKGSRNSEEELPVLIYRLNYLDFPLLFRYHFKKDLFPESENVRLEAGMQFSYLVSAREGDQVFGFINLYDDFQPYTYGYLLGVSYTYKRVLLRLNFQRSLRSLHKSFSYIDRTLSFSLAYRLI